MILAAASTNDVVIAALATVTAVVGTVFGVTRSSSKNAAEVKDSIGDTGTQTIAEMMTEHTRSLDLLDRRVTALTNDFNAYQVKAVGAREDITDQLELLEKRLPKED